MKKRILNIFLAGLVLLSLTACGNSSDPASSSDAKSKTEKEADEDEEKEDKKKDKDNKKDKDTTDSKDASSSEEAASYEVHLQTYDYSYLLPDSSLEFAYITLQKLELANADTDGAQIINDTFSTAFDDTMNLVNGQVAEDGDSLSNFIYSSYAYYNYLQEDGQEPLTSNSISQSYAVQRVDSNVFSIVEDLYAYLGGAHGSHIASGANFDMQTGSPISLTDLSDDYNSFFDHCNEELVALADELMTTEPVLYEGYEDKMDTIMTDDTFYFSEDGLCFISQEYVLQPYAAGTLIFCIPYENLEGYMKDEYFPTENSWNFETTTSASDVTTISYEPNFTDSVAIPMIQSFLTWTGLEYFYHDGCSYDSLTIDAALGMAVYAIEYDGLFINEWYQPETGSYIVPKDYIDSYCESYFGQTFDISAFQPANEFSMIQPAGNDELIVNVGDWGLLEPDFRIMDVIENADGTYTVYVDYFSYDHEAQSESDVMATATYTFAPNANYSFGYVIIDFSLSQMNY